MAMAPGRMLGTYEIRALIGVGGMGEVYRALDTKLHREVAIKVLPPSFARDPERVARFRREAQVLASLNHINIAAIYTFEESGSTHYLVMELVPGETLRDRISKGPVAIKETLTIARQMAEALDHAHEKTVHRDLKPANVKLTPEGIVKVLDFGLAKAYEGDGPATASLDTPTISDVPTVQGTILGTPAYMSPEQARGRKVDKRADLWAFGCVIYELLSGKQAFRGEDMAGTLSKVIETEPDWSVLPSKTPPRIRKLLLRCLQKELRKRFRDAADAQMEIEDALSSPAGGSEWGGPLPLWRRTPAIAAAALIVAALAGLAAWYLKAPAPQPVTRLALTLPAGQHLAALDQPAIAISPDGKNVVYVAVQSSSAGVPAGPRFVPGDAP